MTEETLGKRIASHRKRMGLTQDALAEKLCITAQAVSKWENDQSCPDISMLPKLAKIFDTSTDVLLGLKEEAKDPETTDSQTDRSEESCRGNVTEPGRKTGVGIAVWLLLTGLILLVLRIFGSYGQGQWKILGLTGLMVFGLWGLYPRFSMFRLGCAVTGGYYLAAELSQPAVVLNETLLLPVLMMFFGIGLFLDSFHGKRKQKGHLSINASGKNVFECDGNRFVCSTGFGDDHRVIHLPLLEGGEGNVFFGTLSVDIHNCGCYSKDCDILLRCAFGSLMLQVPRNVRIQCLNKTLFGTVREMGSADPEAVACIRVENNVCFGEICIKYL